MTDATWASLAAAAMAAVGAWKSWRAEQKAEEAKVISTANGAAVTEVKAQNAEQGAKLDGRLEELLKAVRLVAHHEGEVAGEQRERERASLELEKVNRELAAADAKKLIAEGVAEALKLLADQTATAKLSEHAVPAAAVAPPQVIIMPSQPQAITGEVTNPTTGKVTGTIEASMEPPKQEPAP